MQPELPYRSVCLCVCARHGLAAEVTECKVRQEQGVYDGLVLSERAAALMMSRFLWRAVRSQSGSVS